MSWLRRKLQRRYDLARGVDADLVRANRKKWKLAAALLGLAFLIAWIAQKLPLSPAMHAALILAAGVLGIAASIFFEWAWREYLFLHKPDPEPPPSIFKD
jgi:hypothetical protein